ncbi:MAG: cobalamin-dependent protein [Deltaproteobacteria bacterium]|nr:cobalamin-dependent protein [Deltaproteobacteria bacterium]
MKETEKLTEAIVEMEEDQAMAMTRELLESGTAPMAVFEAYQEAMVEVGRRFEKGIYFIPELILSGNMMNEATEIIKPYLDGQIVKDGREKIGKILLATVEGDIHDIGKNIVAALLDLNGFEVKDLGVDVPIDQIVSEARDFGADIVGLSGLLTLAFDPMKELVDKLAATGLRQNTKVIIGGGQMDEQVCEYTGADAFVIDAVAGINLCKEWMSQI